MTTQSIGKSFPDLFSRLLAFDEHATVAARSVGLESRTIELVKIRASQLNRCAYCLRMHTRAALQAGELPDRLAVLPAWRDCTYFTATERAALAIAESVTVQIRNPDNPHPPADTGLTKSQADAVAWLAVSINAWNRVLTFNETVVHPDDPPST